MKQNFFLLSSKRVGIKKSEAASFNALNVLLAFFFRHEKLEFGSPMRLHLALGQIDLVTPLWRDQSRTRQQASWRTSEKESREDELRGRQPQYRKLQQQIRHARKRKCIISYQTNLYGRSGFGLCEFTEKISSQPNLQLCVQHTSMIVASHQGDPFVRWH